MQQQFSQNYNVDNRYKGHEEAVDNTSGKRFLKQYLEQKSLGDSDNVEAQRYEDNRFIIAGPGAGTSRFRNEFRTKQS